MLNENAERIRARKEGTQWVGRLNAEKLQSVTSPRRIHSLAIDSARSIGSRTGVVILPWKMI